MAKKERVVRKPKFHDERSAGALEDMIVRIRLAQVRHGRVGTKRAVNIDGVGTLVVVKQKPGRIAAAGKRIEFKKGSPTFQVGSLRSSLPATM